MNLVLQTRVYVITSCQLSPGNKSPSHLTQPLETRVVSLKSSKQVFASFASKQVRRLLRVFAAFDLLFFFRSLRVFRSVEALTRKHCQQPCRVLHHCIKPTQIIHNCAAADMYFISTTCLKSQHTLYAVIGCRCALTALTCYGITTTLRHYHHLMAFLFTRPLTRQIAFDPPAESFLHPFTFSAFTCYVSQSFGFSVSSIISLKFQSST